MDDRCARYGESWAEQVDGFRGGSVPVRGLGIRQGDGAETVLGGDARRVGALKRR